MTRAQAFTHARAQARRHNRPMYIVWSVEEYDAPREHYHTATEDETDTYYQGCKVIAEIEPPARAGQE